VVESLTNPHISAVSHPLEELGTNAIKILMHPDKQQEYSSFLVTPKIIDRGSVKSLI